MTNAFLTIYKKVISPLHHLIGRGLLGGSYACRYSPTCSVYTATAIRKYGIIHGSILGLRRLLRCHPYSKLSSFDPVP